MEPATLDPRFFTASGLNNAFHGDGLNFDEYCKQTQEMIARARLDLTPENREIVLSANSPFEWQPKDWACQQYHRGILLIHGLTDAPFILKDMGKVFLEHGFLVQSILLPGHGTVPGDLLHVTYEEWVKSARYGFETLKNKVEQVFILGFSLGGTLAVNLALEEPDIAGLILLAPAMGLKNQMRSKLIQSLWALFHGFKWLRKLPQEDYCKYESLALHAADQMLRAIDYIQKKLQKTSLNVPALMILGADDEVVSNQAIIQLFKQSRHPKTSMLMYGDRLKNVKEMKGIEIRNTYFPEQRILDFSHVTLPTSPNNVHYGIHGDYKDFLHYPNKISPNIGDVFLGAPSKKNLKSQVIQRLRYNPDFAGMMEKILAFVKR